MVAVSDGSGESPGGVAAARAEEGDTESTPLIMTPSAAGAPLGKVSERSMESEVSWADDVDDDESPESSVRRRKIKKKKTSFFDLGLDWTDSLRHRAVEQYDGNAYPAAFLLRDAILGTGADMTGVVRAAGAYDFNPHSEENHPWVNGISLICRWVLARSFVYNIVHLATWVLVLMGFLEPPVWCRDYTAEDVGAGCDAKLSAHGPPAFGDATETDVQYYPNTGTAVLTVAQSLAIDWACVGIVTFYMILHHGRDGMSIRRFFFVFRRRAEEDVDAQIDLRHNLGARIIRAVLVFSLVSMIWGLVAFRTSRRARPFAPVFRLLIFVAFSKGTQKELSTVIRMIPELASVLFLLLIVILFYGWIGVVAFFEEEEGYASFSTLVEAMWTLWMCATTVNYPDVMMPAYNKSRVTALYFITFMIITFFFMMNVILALVVNSYNNEVDARRKRLKDINKRSMKMAFKLMDIDKQGWIDREAIMTIFLILNEDCPEIRHIPNETAELLFALLDKSGDDKISEEEFLDFGKVMLVQFESSTRYATCVQRFLPRLYGASWYQSFCRAIRSEMFERMVDIVLVLNAVVVTIQTYPELTGERSEQNAKLADGNIDTIWELFQAGFTAFYCLEMAAKILVLGWRRYVDSYRNIFDGAVTVLSFAATCYVYYPNRYSDSRLIRYVVTARVLRLVRLLAAMKQFQVIGGTFLEIIPAAKRIVVFLFCIMYLFASIGVHYFGGTITRDPSNPLSAQLMGTDFAEADYWANNFNDLLSGFNVLFNLLVVNNWQVQADGILAVVGTKWTRLFFVFFHICGVIIVNNLVVAFIIDSFMSEWNDAQEQGAGGEVVNTGDAVIGSDKRAYFDAQEVTGTKTNLSGEYVARVRDDALFLSTRKSDALKNLFTKGDSLFDIKNESDASA